MPVPPRSPLCLRFETWKLIATLATVVLVYAPAAADDTVTQAASSLESVRLGPEERITLDGVLNEAVWARATSATNFLQQEPDEGAPATERTEVRVVYDTNQLYIGAMLFDSDPSGIIGFQKERDRGLGSDDRFMWILDTFRDGRTGYFFETNPAGLLGDGLLQTGSRGNVNKDWDGIWDLRVTQSELGWSVEVWIPFRTLNFDATSDTWGINFQRTVRRKNEEALWRGHLRNQDSSVRSMRDRSLGSMTCRRDSDSTPSRTSQARGDPTRKRTSPKRRPMLASMSSTA